MNRLDGKTSCPSCMYIMHPKMMEFDNEKNLRCPFCGNIIIEAKASLKRGSRSAILQPVVGATVPAVPRNKFRGDMSSKPRQCPHCKEPIPMDSGFTFDSDLNMVHVDCGKVAFPTSEKNEIPPPAYSQQHQHSSAAYGYHHHHGHGPYGSGSGTKWSGPHKGGLIEGD